MTFARIYARGKWGVSHISPQGEKTLCGCKLEEVQAEVEIVDKPQGKICGLCMNVFYSRQR